MSSIDRLRRATANDAETIFHWREEPSSSTFQPTLRLTPGELRSVLRERALSVISPQAIGKLQWIVEAGEQPVVGWISLTISEEDRRHDKGEIGYTIGERFRGKGYGSAAVSALLPIAFSTEFLNLARLGAVAALENMASRRVLEKNGFHNEGTLRELLVINGVRVDHASYGLLRTDWEESGGRNSDGNLRRGISRRRNEGG